jgi:formiminotetrahydrofolate cyclodeaminase
MVDVLECLEGLIGRSNERLASDLAIAAVLGEASVRSAAWNVHVNAVSLEDGGERFVREADGRVERAVEIARQVEAWSRSVSV